ncbi:MAG: hypothetical protein ACXADH_07010 [Candidatus Kariarchaeaceae archaeon]|jgi:hypothetical protein
MAFGIEGFNIEDTPAFQRQLQKINALPGYHQGLARGAVKQATAQHASAEFDKHMRSMKFAAEREEADSALKIATQKLKLDRESSDQLHQYRMDKMGIEQEAFDRDIEERMPSLMGGLLGLGTHGYGLYQDRLQRERQDEFRNKMLVGSFNNRLPGDISMDDLMLQLTRI